MPAGQIQSANQSHLACSPFTNCSNCLVVSYFINLPSLQLLVLHNYEELECLWETALCYKCTACHILGFCYELWKSEVNLIKFHKLPQSFINIINSKINRIVGGKSVWLAIPCRVWFWPVARERLPIPALESQSKAQKTQILA